MNELRDQTVVDAPHWQGFHHVALVTPDLDQTIAFYVNTLGMEAGPIFPPVKTRGRHCFVKPGNSDAWGIHFFEHKDAIIHQSTEELKRLSEDRNSASLFGFLPGALQHIAFSISSESEGIALRNRLQKDGIIVTEVYDQGKIRNFIFLDNNGVQLEAAWPKE